MHDQQTVAAEKRILTLDAVTGRESLEDLLQAWSQESNEIAKNPRLIRVIGKTHTIEAEIVGPGKANYAKQPEMTGIDLSRDELLSPFGIATLKDRYMLPEEKSPQEAFMRAATAFGDDPAHAQRLYDYASKGYFSFATPVLSNAPVRKRWGEKFELNFVAECYDAKKRGLPISCFLNFVPDSRKGLTEHYAENAWLSSIGGGVGGYWGAIRSNGIDTSGGSRSSGMIPFMKVVDSEVMAFAQGVTRRASYAAYADISHPEIVEFLEIRKPTGGDANRKCLNLHNAVNIPDAFMEIIERCMKDPNADDSWPLVDPHTMRVVQTVSAKELWQRILELRVTTGEPYMHFIDTTNRALPRAQREAGLRVHQSNLCSEITLPTNEDRTAVCCLSSVNLEMFDEWSKLPLFIEDLIRMLDNVLEYFIQNAPDEIYKAKYSAKMERSVGLGAMGFHSYLQKKSIPFESAMATSINRQQFSAIKRKAEAATVKLAQERGPCPDAAGEMRRNMHLLSIAPNASSSDFVPGGGTSPAIEPHRANAFTRKTQSGSWLAKNKYLEAVLDAHGMDDEETWSSIITNRGSVQHLDFLSQDEKDVFKTAMELDQRWIIEHAHHRQEYICQAQSLNLFLPADVDILTLHHVHFRAWKAGLKTLYYVRSEAIKRADNVSVKLDKAVLRDTDNVCLSCEG
jgi:ribonucleoside-diphosphate reductase alpha chain